MKINESHVIANTVAEVVNIFKKAELKPELDKMQAAIKNLEKTFKAKGYEQQGTYEFGGLKGHFWKIDTKDFDLAKDIIKGEIAKASLKENFDLMYTEEEMKELVLSKDYVRYVMATDYDINNLGDVILQEEIMERLEAEYPEVYFYLDIEPLPNGDSFGVLVAEGDGQSVYEFAEAEDPLYLDEFDRMFREELLEGKTLEENVIEENTDELDAEMMHIYQLVLDTYPNADPEEVKEAVIVTFYEIEEYNEFNLREEEVVSRIAEVLGLNKITESVDLNSQEVHDLEYVLAKYGWELVEVTKRNVGKFYKTNDVDSPVLFVNLTNMSIANPEVLEDEAINELEHYI